MHFCLGPSTEQFELPEKLLEPEMVPIGDPKVMVAPPFLDAVLVSLTTLLLEVPTRTFPKLTEAGDTLIAAGTFGVGVAVGVTVGVEEVAVTVGVAVWVGVGAAVCVAVGVGV